MIDAPSQVDQEQLDELGIGMKRKEIEGVRSVAWAPPEIAGTLMMTQSTRYCMASVAMTR